MAAGPTALIKSTSSAFRYFRWLKFFDAWRADWQPMSNNWTNLELHHIITPPSLWPKCRPRFEKWNAYLLTMLGERGASNDSNPAS